MTLPVALAPARPVIRQQNPIGGGAMVPAQWIDCVSLTANVVSPYTMPTGATILRLTLFSNTFGCYYCVTGTPSIPVTNITNGTCTLQPIQSGDIRSFPQGTVLDFFSGGTAFILIEAWA